LYTLVVRKQPDVSDKHTASVFRVEIPFRLGLVYFKLGLPRCTLNLQSDSAGLPFDPEYGGDMFLLNVGFFRSSRRYNPEDCTLETRSSEKKLLIIYVLQRLPSILPLNDAVGRLRLQKLASDWLS
jgi:hypothetical protein